MRRLLLTVLVLLLAAACGGDDAPASTDAAATPLERAQAATDRFYDKHEKILDALAELETGAVDETEEERRTFDPADDCEGMDRKLTDDEVGMMGLYFGQTLIDNGTDLGTWAKDLEAHRLAIVETGVCDGVVTSTSA